MEKRKGIRQEPLSSKRLYLKEMIRCRQGIHDDRIVVVMLNEIVTTQEEFERIKSFVLQIYTWSDLWDLINDYYGYITIEKIVKTSIDIDGGREMDKITV